MNHTRLCLYITAPFEDTAMASQDVFSELNSHPEK